MKHLATFLSTVLFAAAGVEAKPLKVFILAGQSNMEGPAHIRTIEGIGDDPVTAPMLKDMLGPEGKPVVCPNVWLSYLTGEGDNNAVETTGRMTAGYGSMWGLDHSRPGDKIGPEFTFGIYMSKAVKEPILIIKTAWGGKQGYELAGFVWLQAWNDWCDSWWYPAEWGDKRFDEYGRLMAMFIRDVRKDLSAPKMPFVIGVAGFEGLKAGKDMQSFREAMASPSLLPEFKGNVFAVQTASFWDDHLATLQARVEANWPKVDAKVREEKDESWENKMKHMSEDFTPEEWKYYQHNGSNAGYHYLGCAKTFALMGKAFAEATVNLQKTQGQEKQ
jgi:hypothetical protein